EDNEDVEVTLLSDSGADLHNFNPTADDFVKIWDSDLFVYIGGLSENWANEASRGRDGEELKSIRLINWLEDRLVEGHHHDHDDHDHVDDHADDHEDNHADDHADDHEDNHADDHADEPADEHHDDNHSGNTDTDVLTDSNDNDEPAVEVGAGIVTADEHIWLSVQNAKICVENLRDVIVWLDPGHTQEYKQNADNYIQKLEKLDEEYRNLTDQNKGKAVIFGDSFPFVYLFNDYGLEHFAAHDGCSSEASASFERIVSLSQKADELGVNAICALENSDQKVANAVKDSAKNKELKILTLDSMQSCDPDNRKEYCEIMEDNLNVLKELLDY
ncbi:MAG: metal ABC transporter substrate-binding protein, partial [Lachnospiraceae bacterium]|nr:metal ABC transporter substrate-binding protein [Lachnospiraceae bacterium]